MKFTGERMIPEFNQGQKITRFKANILTMTYDYYTQLIKHVPHML